MKVITGDLIKLAKQGEFDVIVHGCNCFCTMGKGIALAVKTSFPAVYQADVKMEKGDRAKLGNCSFAEVETGGHLLTIVNAYTQFSYTGRGPKVDYDAIRSCFQWIKLNHGKKRIGFPKIGAGLAGGDWERIASIIEEELAGADMTLVEHGGG